LPINKNNRWINHSEVAKPERPMWISSQLKCLRPRTLIGVQSKLYVMSKGSAACSSMKRTA
jgi:hypothetical protein